MLPSYMGILINHYKDPYEATTIMESKSFFSGLIFEILNAPRVQCDFCSYKWFDFKVSVGTSWSI